MNTVSETLLSANPMRIGGITPLTTIRFPGRLAADAYWQGRPPRCRQRAKASHSSAFHHGLAPFRPPGGCQ